MVSTPELKKYMDKKVLVHLNGARSVTGQLKGYDLFLNIVLENTVDHKEQIELGSSVIRGNSILSIECLENI